MNGPGPSADGLGPPMAPNSGDAKLELGLACKRHRYTGTGTGLRVAMPNEDWDGRGGASGKTDGEQELAYKRQRQAGTGTGVQVATPVGSRNGNSDPCASGGAMWRAQRERRGEQQARWGL